MGRSVVRKASFGLDVLSRVEACLLRGRDDTTNNMKHWDEQRPRGEGKGQAPRVFA